ncbi:alpha/beta fold hydrolase [Microlunatus aurantiacus]|uniref:Alpha/beta fold hydrolase n=1 Tax=Microlunatus aurantiacus TaxID=446786 RepID=A0ABP7DMI1_9ACTN
MSAAAPAEEPLVLLPGMGCSARLWAGAAPEQALTPRLTEPSLAAQVDRLLDELPPRFVIVGLSLGAVVAMAVTRTAPERVAGLVLLSTNPYGPTEQQLVAWRRERDRLAAGESARELQQDLLPLLLSPASLSRRPDLVETTLAMADDVGETELDAQLRLQATRVDERPGLRAVRCPTLVIAARHDRLCPLDRHAEVVTLVPGGRLQVLERAAHLSPLERPRSVRRLLAGRS